jgi:hypothetical protein
MGTIPAVIVHTSGLTQVVNLDTGYKAIQAVVGGTFDAITSDSGKTTFWIHDEGKIIGLEPNVIATKILWELNPVFHGRDYLAGTVLITGGADDEGDTLGIGSEGLTAVGRAKTPAEWEMSDV